MLVAETKMLQAAKKAKSENIQVLKWYLKGAWENANAILKEMRKLDCPILQKIEEECLKRHSIVHPYYHNGGEYNGKSMNAFMTNQRNDVAQLGRGRRRTTRMLQIVY